MKKPLFNFGPPKRITKKDKKLNYKQARKKIGLRPFGDADRDGYFNIYDCKPLDRTKHMGVYKARKDIKHQVYDSPKGFMTEGDIFSQAEKLIPKLEYEKDQEGGDVSDRFTDALKRRKRFEEKEGDTAAKNLVGIYDIDRPKSASDETVFAQRHIKKHLEGLHPEKQFRFDPYNPKIVQVLKDDKFKPVKVSKALSMSPPGIETRVKIGSGTRRKVEALSVLYPTLGEEIDKIESDYSYKPPFEIEDLPRHFTSGKKIKLEITDNPARVLAKSDILEHTYSCEKVGSEHYCGWGGFDDVKLRHPTAYFYLGNKVPLKDSPSARVSLRRAHPVGDYGRVDDTKEYIGVVPISYGAKEGEAKNMFSYFVQDVVKKKGLFHLPLKTKYTREKGYSDVSAHFYSEHKGDEGVPSITPFLSEELMERAEEEGDDSLIEDIDSGEEPDYDNMGSAYFKNMPDVFTEELKDPYIERELPTFKEARESIIALPSSRDQKPKKIPKSFFTHLLRSSSEVIRQRALSRPSEEIRWQEKESKKIKEELKKSNIDPVRRKTLEDRLKRGKKELKDLKTSEPEYFHQMAFDTSEPIRRSVSEYPRLQQKTVKALMPEKKYVKGKETPTPKMEYGIREGLFFNPSLTFKQRKAVGKSDQEGEDKLVRISSRLDSETDPRVAREVVNIYAPEEVKRIVSTSSKPALHEIYKTYPQMREDVVLNPSAPEALVQQYITDISTSQHEPASKKLQMITHLLESKTLSSATYQRIYNMYKDNEEVLGSMLSHNVPKSIKDKIEGKILKSDVLTQYAIDNPSNISSGTLKNLVKTFSKQNFLKFVVKQALYYHGDDIRNKNEIVQEVIKRMLKEPTTAPDVMSVLSSTSMKSETVDKELMRVLGRSTVSKKLFSQVLDYLMKSSYHNTREELVKKFG